jgi:O-6-methylguanine DNA methyltransferase
MTRTRRLVAAYIALAAAVAVLFALNLFWGSVSLAPGAVLTALLGKGGDALAGNIILQLRLPRAVMAALLGANPLSIVVPCHRVIGTDGSLTGYAWGLPMKEALLDLERH